MSTLKVNTIQDTSAGNSTTPVQLSSGRCRGWVNFEQYSSLTVRDSYNVSSVTDDATATFTVNWDTDMPNDDYVTFGQCRNDNGTGKPWMFADNGINSASDYATDSVTFKTGDWGSNYDTSHIFVCCFSKG